MKRLWTLDDIKGFIKRYAEPKGKSDEIINWVEGYAATKKDIPQYYASWIDFLNTGEQGIGLQTQEIIFKDANIAVSGYDEFLDWFCNHPTIRIQVQGYIRDDNLMPMYLILDESGKKVMLVCRNKSTNALESSDLRNWVDDCASGYRNLDM